MLMLPRIQQSMMQSNLPATPARDNVGVTTIAANATINTKGSWVELITATNFDVYGITLTITGDSASAVATANLCDLGVGAAGVEVPIVTNLLNTSSGTFASSGGPSYFLPLFVPKGTRLAGRKQSNVTSKTSIWSVFLHGGFSFPPWPTFVGADCIGANTADSGGVTIVAGSTGAESAWTNVGSTLGRDYSAMMPIVSTGSDTTMTSLGGHVEFGISSTTMGEYKFTINNTENMGQFIPTIPTYGFFPSGSQMMVRAEMSGVADDDYEFAVLGFY